MESPLRTRAHFSIAWWAPLLVAIALADVLLAAWWEGSVWFMATCASTIVVLLVSAACLAPRPHY